nr:unnamed protein product [Callosobruchus chinensis]
MTAIGFGCTGTIRENRIKNCPLNKKDVKQKQRGFTNSFVNEDKSMIVIQWKDNSTVQVASNAYGVLPTKSAKRYSAAEKKNITVDMPNAINLYNENMGGTDLMDRNISNYRIKIRNNKWYWQTFTHLLSASASNAWILHKIEVEERKAFGSSLDSFEKVEPALDFLSFIRDIVSTYLLLNTKRDSVGRPKSRYVLTRKVPAAVSLNHNLLHYPETLKQNRCKICKKNSTFGCGICRINLHPLNCFKVFHETQ